MTKEDYQKIIDDLEKKLVVLNSDTNHILIHSEKAVSVCKFALLEMRDIVLKNGFENQQDEICFFRDIKPKVYSHLLYNTHIFSIETKRPNSSNKVQRKYLISELDKIQIFINDNLEFYQYYRCRATNLDDHFFIRGKSDLRLSLGNILFLSDEQFCTSHDHTVSFIQAYDMLTIYLKKELAKLNSENVTNSSNEKEDQIRRLKLYWTEHKVSAIELIYAIHESGVVNHGISDIKDLKEGFELLFNIDLGDIYRSFVEIQARKKERTKFIDILRNCLLSRMDEGDK